MSPGARRKMVTATLVAGGAFAFAAPAHAATFTVTNTNSANAGSLRAAINDSESQPGRDRIEFAIPGAGPHRIVPATDLPVVSRPVTIDGYSEPGAVEATDTAPADLMVSIDASNALRGLELGGGHIELRGLAVHSAQGDNVFIEGHDIVMAGNHLGTNRAGTAADQYAGCNVTVYGANNLIGGPAPADRNVISGRGTEICVEGGTHKLLNNRIGTNAEGTAALGYSYGAMIGTSGNTVGDNLISGLFVGLELLGDDNIVHGNRIGTNAAGTAAVPNGLGLNVEGGDRNVIGGAGTSEGNLISGNDWEAIQLERGDDPGEGIGPAEGNRVLGNLIGVDVSGTVALANGGGFAPPIPAVSVNSSNDNEIGGDAPGEGNVIAANGGDGLQIVGSGATQNEVLGNWIGTNADGDGGLGNGANGVSIELSSTDNQIGSPTGASTNTIVHNGDDGVSIDPTGARNAVVANAIFANGSGAGDLGVDLGDDGVTVNDPDDADAGANALLNHPVPTAADAATGTVDWTLDARPATDYRLDFYASASCDDAGSGEGERHLGARDTTTDAAGEAAATATPPAAPAAGERVTMTATRRGFAGPLPLGLQETSELSTCVVAG